MRHRYGNMLAWGVGALLAVLSLVFALTQTL